MSFFNKLAAQLPLGKKSENTEYFFALNIGLSEVTAAVWSVFGSRLDILGQKSFAYHGTEELMEKAYKALDQSLGALEIEPQKVLFGVPDSWGADDNLKEPYLKLLRRMLKEFDLQPLAYVSTTNAISHLIQKQEGVPPTAILLGVGDFIEVTLMRGGKLLETRSTEKTAHLFEDIEKTLSQFTEVEVLPSKILLYPTKVDENLSKVKDDLMSYPWMSKLSFLHFPKIDVLDEEITTKAIVFAGAIEIYPDVDLKHSFAALKHSGGESSGVSHARALRAEPETVSQDDDLGFVKGDIKEKSQNNETELTGEEEELNDDNLVSPDIEEGALKEEFESRRPKGLSRAHPVGTAPRDILMEDDEPAVYSHKKDSLPVLASLQKTVLVPLQKNLRHLPKFKGSLVKLLIIPAVLVVFVAAYIYFVKASVTIFVEPRVLEKETQVVADPGATAIDEEKKIIPGSIVETTVSGTGKAAATGTKQIGDPAKGKVVIYNKTTAPHTFSQGTILVSSDNLKFVLDTSVTVASQSAVTGGISFGKISALVTASAIGPESNILGGTDLTIAQFSKDSYIATVDEALSGGTSKNVTVVTSDDQKKLQAQVLNDLRQKAVEELQGKMTADKKVITEGLAVADGKYNFNKSVNDQASEFSLSASVRFKGTAYNDADLRTIVSKLVETNVPEGFEFNLQDTETQADVAKVEKDGKLIFKAKFKAKLLPKLNLEELKQQMRGKTADEVAAQLKGMENVMGSEIVLIPNLPANFARLPIWDKNISIIVTPK